LGYRNKMGGEQNLTGEKTKKTGEPVGRMTRKGGKRQHRRGIVSKPLRQKQTRKFRDERVPKNTSSLFRETGKKRSTRRRPKGHVLRKGYEKANGRSRGRGSVSAENKKREKGG